MNDYADHEAEPTSLYGAHGDELSWQWVSASPGTMKLKRGSDEFLLVFRRLSCRALIKRACIALCVMFVSAPSGAFDLDRELGEVKAAMDARTVDGLPANKLGYLQSSGFCQIDQKLFLIASTEVIPRPRLSSHVRVKRLPRRKVAVDVNYNRDEVRWSKKALARLYGIIRNSSKPCSLWLELFGGAPDNVLAVTTIDGFASLSDLMKNIGK